VSRPAVFLDRDGVLNEVVVDGESVRSPRTRSEFHIVDGVIDSVRRLAEADRLTVVVTNQPDVARGHLSIADADHFTEVLYSEIGVDLVMECRHDSSAGCECRKPRPGMLLEAARRLDIDLTRSFLVGDRLVDVVAAERAGVSAILLQRWWSERPSSDGTSVRPGEPFLRVERFDEAVDQVLSCPGGE